MLRALCLFITSITCLCFYDYVEVVASGLNLRGVFTAQY